MLLPLGIDCGGEVGATHGQVAVAAADATEGGGTEGQASAPFACGENLLDGETNTCAPSQYCQIACGTSDDCRFDLDASTCPALTAAAGSPTDLACPYDWLYGGAPNDDCCEGAIALYACVEARPSQPAAGGPGTEGPCLTHDGREFFCACQKQ